MQACDDLRAVGRELAVLRESVGLVRANSSERAAVQRDQDLGLNGRVA
jgi:hypothetical protein